ncbi:type II toxin-antitoxin system VapB family antitoxin [Consotaella aegiceratis]|uniref:type II toxin-antitoxin system VapB family antitoxin n=1 Tax=Consotaella aegiceratis TaxID=3097961 RepID=UPI002F42CAE6
MPLYIRDDSVNNLAEELARVSMAASKTEAVRLALQHELERLAAQESLVQKVATLQERAASHGLRTDGFDDKPLMDELSGNQ